MKYILIICCLLQAWFPLYAQLKKELSFTNFDKGGSLIQCFFQDDKGIVWIGTSAGLSIYNGRGVSRHDISVSDPSLKKVSVSCAVKRDSTHYYLGTNKGLILFDLKANFYRLLAARGMEVKTVQCVNDSTILLGALTGLYKYNVLQDTFRQVDKIPQLPINPIVRLDADRFLIANYHGLYLYNGIYDTYEYLSVSKTNPSLVLAITVDPVNKWAWIGTENGLWKFDIAAKAFTEVRSLSNNIIKNIHISSDNKLWLGTDYGLYIYDWQLNTYQYILHNSKDEKSLVNNIIWSIFEDREQNIWLGTEMGISLCYNSRTVENYPWDNLMGSEEGNNIRCMYRDSRGNFWWGGSNGLGYYDTQKKRSLWYRMNQGKYSISHNQIRWIYEDWEHDLWIATDGGINRFDYETETFENYKIVDSTHSRNANWTYYINGDKKGNLYLVAYCGGVFVVNKKELLSQNKTEYVAKENYYQHSGGNSLHSNFVSFATMDGNGCLWVPAGEHFLDKIDFKTKQVHSYDFSKQGIDLSGRNMSAITYDPRTDELWIAMKKCIGRVSVKDGSMETIDNSILVNRTISVIEDAGEWLWIATSDGIYAYEKNMQKLVYTGIGGHWFSLYYDTFDHKVWAGGIDQCLAFNPTDKLKASVNKGNIILSGLYVNEKSICSQESYDGNVIVDANLNYTGQIHLLHHQNNIAFEFLNTQYDPFLKPHYLYRLKGVDKDWRNVEDFSTRISYNNLAPGEYVFEMKELTGNENVEESISCFRTEITVGYPWYQTYWAKCGYALLAGLLIWWIISYFKEKNRFRMEHIEREKTLELSNLKMEFLTNMSHELKTPLSLIVSPVSQLLAETRNAQVKESLSLIHANAVKLNGIVHQILNIKEWNGTEQKLSPSSLEMVSFVDCIVRNFQENQKNKDVTIRFHSSMEHCFMEVDIPKMEMIMNNLLSNACKFLQGDGVVDVSLDLLEDDVMEVQKLVLRIVDNGVGIPAADLSHIFERFYQAGNSRSMNEDGSGIGLSIVKKYVELHQGEIQLKSEEGKGTEVLVYIPVEQLIKSSSEEGLKNPDADEKRYKILIAEDNVEIAHFISQNMPNAECLIAYNGKVGLEMAQQNLPDIIIADIMMPVMDGLDMVKRLKADKDTSTIPVIMLTAKDDKETEYDLLALGVEAFISKPFDMRELKIHIERILRNKYKLASKWQEERAAGQETEAVVIESQDEKFINYITGIIEQNLSATDLNVTTLAELSGYGSKQIYRRVKELTGYTTVNYIKSIRMKRAALLLSQKQFMVSEVMYMVGFSDSSYFSKCFVEKYGKTPKQYMESI